MKARMRSFFDEENRMTKISKIGDPLEALNAIIKWEMFRDILKKNIVRKENNKGGRPPFDMVMMFKILVLERLYNLSDDQAEFQINDRRSFMRFLGLESLIPARLLTPHLSMHLVSVILVRKTKKSRMAKFRRIGRSRKMPQNGHKRIQMHAGQRKTERHILAIKTM